MPPLLELEIEIKGFDDVLSMEDRLEKAVNVDDVADQAAAIVLNRTRTRFLDQVDPDGHQWPESYAAKHRREIGRGGGTLFDTGRLFHSIHVDHRGPGDRAVTTNVPYAGKHNYGIGVVRRTFMGVNADDQAIIRALLIKRLQSV